MIPQPITFGAPPNQIADLKDVLSWVLFILWCYFVYKLWPELKLNDHKIKLKHRVVGLMVFLVMVFALLYLVFLFFRWEYP